MRIKETITYDDVLLEPQYSDVESRKEVDLSSCLQEDLITLSLPIISSPMDTVTEDVMANAMNSAGGLGIIHRYNSIEKQVKMFKKSPLTAGCAIGMTGDYLERALELYEAGCILFCIDVAHGHHVSMKTALQKLKSKFPDVHIMAGNVATVGAFTDLANWGADSIRVGIGNGSICSTRTQTGHGVPSLTAIMECSRSLANAKLIADGGIRNSGDIVKALAAGADFVMLGSLLAGTDESPGQVIEFDDRTVKRYRGMASPEAQRDWKGSTSSLEGISTTIPYKGSVVKVLENLETGIRSGLSYTGARNLSELRSKAVFIKQSNASVIESDTHILLRNR